MTIHKRLLFAMVAIAVLGMGAYLMVASWQSHRQAESARSQISELVESSTIDTSAAIMRLIAAQDEALKKQVESELNVARKSLARAGKVSLTKDEVRWSAQNQLTFTTTNVALPRMVFGSTWLGQNSNPTVRTPLVDDEHRLVGGSMAILQRMNAEGDMMRIATSVEGKGSRRTVGTYIPHLTRSGNPNPVIERLLIGLTYRGVDWVQGHYCVTCYEPLKDASGAVVGAIYTGEREENVAGLRDAIMRSPVGTTGEILVLAGSGDKQGTCLMAEDWRDGEDLTSATDTNGFPYVGQIMRTASGLTDAESSIVRYTLRNGKGTTDVTARVTYYKPWDWIVVIEAHPKDFARVFARLYNSGNATVVAFLLICGAMLSLTLPILWMEGNERARRGAEWANTAKSNFLSRMSHELRTPLNAILGFAQILEMDELTAEQSDSVGHIRGAGKHLLTLINEVLDMSRIESGALNLSMEPVSVASIAKEVQALMSPLAEENGIDVTTDLDARQDVTLLADRQRLTQVLINLVSNAIKYNRPGGSVRIHADIAAEFGRLMVSDTGQGIPSDRVATIFTPFDRLGAEQTKIEGTGLGLALSKHLIEQMGGKISFETGAAGTTFFVAFPKAELVPDEDVQESA